MYHIIINPASRSGKGRKLWKEIVEPALHKEGIVYRSYFSESAGDVARLAKEITSSAKEPLELIILGGDGTVNEALQGISNPTNVILGYIPTGSSNDLARDLKIPKDPLKALDRILHTGTIHSMDMGTIAFPDGETRHFAVSTGIGFDAAVCAESLHSRIKAFCNKIGLGKLTYLGIALKQLFAAKKVSSIITVEDSTPIHVERLLFVAAMNHRFEGGGFQFCPDADATDGILNLCAVGDVPKLLILLALPTAFFGKHYLFNGITPYRGRKVHISASSPLWVHTDGEVIRQTREFTIECHQNVLRIRY